MLFVEFLKNPLVMSIFAVVLCTVYMKFTMKSSEYENKKIKYSVSVGVVVFFGILFYNKYKITPQQELLKIPINLTSSSPLSNIKMIKNDLPYVFIEAK